MRDEGFMGQGCSHDMYVNNHKVFAIRQGEYLTLSLDPGHYLFRLETGGGLCPNVVVQQRAELKGGTKLIYRILQNEGGTPLLIPQP